MSIKLGCGRYASAFGSSDWVRAGSFWVRIFSGPKYLDPIGIISNQNPTVSRIRFKSENQYGSDLNQRTNTDQENKDGLSSKSVGYILLSTGPKVFQKERTSPELKIEEYLILWNSRKLQAYQEKLLQSPVYLKISRNNLLSTGPYLSMRKNSNMVLFPEYKKAKEQHKNHNMPRRSDLNQARNVIKEFEHPSIQGRTMYSSVIGGSNEEGTWRSTDSAANTDGPATMTDSVESTHPNHEGGSRNVEQSTQAQPEESSVAHDQDEMPSESDVETQVSGNPHSEEIIATCSSLSRTEDDEDEDKNLELGPMIALKEQLEKDKDHESLRRWKEQLLGIVDLEEVGD
ncbi:hypothetical protein F2Q69_00060710 [Brassica cretica]|uniref:Uncharacterized protein n=1 Tax=Brassica cretica TaxID=69181 RepID=A0A8S9RE39_BRACR|nr:hypothetical protein F2Q69_00060710 [Brassica cretica]